MSSNITITQSPTDHTRLVLTAGFPQFGVFDLFDYFTKPELLTSWWPQKALIELKPGGRYHFSWPAMNWQLQGELQAYETGQRLLFSWQWLHQPESPPRNVEIVFLSEDAGSKIILTQGPYTNSRHDQEERQGHWDGWKHFLAQLQKLGQAAGDFQQ